MKIVISGQIKQGEKKRRVYETITMPERNLTLGYAVDILEKKYGSLDGYDLWHISSEKPMALNVPLSMLGKKVNSLELRAKEGMVSIKPKKKRQCKLAFQMPDGSRVQGQFYLTDTLWECLVKVERTLASAKSGANLLRRQTKQGKYEQPCLVALGQQFNSIESLQKTTLKKLGLRKKDTLLIRLSYVQSSINFKDIESLTKPQESSQEPKPQKTELTKQTEKKKEEAKQPQNPAPQPTLVDLPQQPKLVENTAPPRQTHEKVEKEVKQDDKMVDEGEDEDVEMEENKDVVVQFEGKMVAKEVKLFMTGTGKDDDSEVTDEDFKMTPHRLKAIYSAQQKRIHDRQVFRSRSEDQAKKERVYEKCLIRIRFPSGLIVQANLKPKNKIKRIRQLLDELLNQEDVPYYLYTTPPRIQYNDPDVSLKKLGLVPAVIMNIGLDTKLFPKFNLNIKKKYIKYVQNLSEQFVPQGKSANQTIEKKVEKKANKLFKSIFGKKKKFTGQGRTLGS